MVKFHVHIRPVFSCQVTFYHKSLSPLLECSKVLDIAFMIDSSGSLDTSDFNRALDFVKTIVYGLTINSDGSGSRVAALSYSKQVDLGFDLNDYYDKGSIIKKIGKLTYFGSGTYTHLGLRTLATKVFQTTYGARSTQEGDIHIIHLYLITVLYILQVFLELLLF